MTLLLPDFAYLRELHRPWKLLSFTVGMIWLIYGALNYQIADWDVGISLIMGALTYLCAPWSVRVILISLRDRQRNWWLWIVAALVVAWTVIDGVYVAYHRWAGNTMYREANFYASSALYFFAGGIWLYRGSVRDFMKNIRSIFIGHQ